MVKKKAKRPGPTPGLKPVIHGARVRALRESRGWTQVELAYRCACTPAQISSIENGKSDPSLRLLLNLVDVLGIPADYLLGRIPN